MVNDQKVVVVMPAYNASETLEVTYREIDSNVVDEIILVDDASVDGTAEMSRELDIETIVHDRNKGYGANQKTCYRRALEKGADIVVMLHPDYQYTPKLIPAMAHLISSGFYDVVLGSRILPAGALGGGMPLYKYIANRILTFFENVMLRQKLSEYHTGYRAFSRQALEIIPFENNSDDFVFDNQILAQAIYFNLRIGEISCPTKYFKEASSINLRRSIVYGIEVLITSLQFVLQKWGIKKYHLFESDRP